ncbi:S-phase kinase-associated protein 1 [Dioscorea alata]|uniref:S-phase kinase-associated protein 1 n=1 Tax=Dioscorea alata TaxID=55571 RepID=A0ACB7WVK5_DIOAL|nr:S-phase kinase-associated protein 1 [Dioscorea alata]
MASMDVPEEVKKKKKVNLISSDGKRFEVDVDLAKQSPIIAPAVKQHDGNDPPTISINVPSEILPKIIDYWETHAQEEPESVRKKNELWDAEFVKMDTHLLAPVIMAAHYLEMTELVELTCQRVADMIKGKTIEEMHEILGIENNLTKEEEDELRQQIPWAFQDDVPDEEPNA